MAVRKNISSEAILSLAQDFDGKVAGQIETAKRSVDGAEVSGLSFGLIGAATLAPIYSKIMDDFKEYLTELDAGR